MVIFDPIVDKTQILQHMAQNPESLLVVCYCAQWCRTCKSFATDFQNLGQNMPDTIFVWVDIEEYDDLLDDFDIDNFPTLLIQRGGGNLFFGPILPKLGQLQRLLSSFQNQSHPFVDGPRDFCKLLQF